MSFFGSIRNIGGKAVGGIVSGVKDVGGALKDKVAGESSSDGEDDLEAGQLPKGGDVKVVSRYPGTP